MWRTKKPTGDRPPSLLDEPSAIDPLASKENAEAFGVGFGIGGVVGGAAALYAKAEQEARENAKPHPRGQQAGNRPKGAHRK